MNSVRILPPDLVNQIAAGEVIERPASVVKELVENAIDAGANTIIIETKGSGCELIRVSDDGTGMTGEELETAILRHATSKITNVDDLFAIRTLGFRGEALPSILSVSRAVISTRQEQARHGHSLTIDGGVVVKRSLKGMPQGTTIEVADLFFNTPARRKFLKTTATEQRNVIDVVTRYGLAYPALRIVLSVDGRYVLNLPGDSTLHDRASSVLGSRLAGAMAAFARERPGIRVSGLLAMPGETRQNRSGIHAFVNRRSVKDAMLGAAVMEGYSGLLMRGRYPVALLFVDIDPAEVDVNVHPSKAEVRFRHPGAVFSLVASAIREILAPGRVQDRDVSTTSPPVSLHAHETRQESVAWDALPPTHTDGMEVREEPRVTYGPRIATRMNSEPGSLFHDGPPDRDSGFTYGELSLIGVFHSTYLLLQDSDSLYVMDQHAAHERITYERLRRAYASGRQAGQALLTPVVMDLSVREYAAFEEAAEALGKMGIECEPFGDLSIALRSVPQPLADKDIREAVRGLLHAIDEGEYHAGGSSDRFEGMLATIACHASVRAGKPLTLHEARALLDDLTAEGSPLTCPHGRPLFRKIPYKEVERWLGRRT